MSSEDYWNASAGTSFQFDDDPILSEDKLHNDVIFQPKLHRAVLPIEELLSTDNLDIVLDDLQFAKETPKINESALNKMLHKRVVVLADHRSSTQKLKLLDEAIASNDGDTILNVVLFLSASLDDQLFLRLITTREVALQLYTGYLFAQRNTSKLESLYMLGYINFSPLRLMSLYMDEIFPVDIKLKRAIKFQKLFKLFMTRDFEKLLLDNYILNLSKF